MYDVWEERVCVYSLHMILFLAVLTAYISMSARGNPSVHQTPLHTNTTLLHVYTCVSFHVYVDRPIPFLT